MKLRYLSLLIISIFVFSSFSFCQGTIKNSNSSDESGSISILYGNFIGIENFDNVKPIFGFSLSEPIGKKFYNIPEYFNIRSEDPRGFLKYYSLAEGGDSSAITKYKKPVLNLFVGIQFPAEEGKINPLVYGFSFDIPTFERFKIPLEIRIWDLYAPHFSSQVSLSICAKYYFAESQKCDFYIQVGAGACSFLDIVTSISLGFNNYINHDFGFTANLSMHSLVFFPKGFIPFNLNIGICF
jgi:hypothetical protein